MSEVGKFGLYFFFSLSLSSFLKHLKVKCEASDVISVTISHGGQLAVGGVGGVVGVAGVGGKKGLLGGCPYMNGCPCW